jgi:hypothetical protein
MSDKAFRVYILSITYSSSRKTKGILGPLDVKTILRLAMADDSVVEELLKLKAWENGKHDFAMSFAIHDYGIYNPEDLHKKRSVAGKLGAQKRWQNGKTIANANTLPSMAKWQNDGKVHGKRDPVPVPESKVKNNVKDSEHSPEKTKFVPPSVEEAEAFFKLQGFPGYGEQFVAHYGSQDWLKGNSQPITDWKLCIVAWIKKQKTSTYPNGKPQDRLPEDVRTKAMEQRAQDVIAEKIRSESGAVPMPSELKRSHHANLD